MEDSVRTNPRTGLRRDRGSGAFGRGALGPLAVCGLLLVACVAVAQDVGANDRSIGLLEWFGKGGVFMWPLLACSIIGLAFILERAAALHRADLEVRQFFDLIIAEVRTKGVDAAIESCKRRPGPIANIIEAGLQRFPLGAGAVEKAMETAGGIEASFLQRGLIWMATVANVAPLFGFLGTVSGMISAFDAIAAADRVSAKIVASGISEALITTEAGLLIAIPVQTAHNYFAARIERLLVEVEESSLDLLAEAERRDAQRG